MGEVKKIAGKLIRKVRKKKGLTQKELGERIGVAATTVTNYETGNQNLSLDTLEKIAEAMGVQLNITMD